MKLEHRTDLSDYFELCSLCDDDVDFIALFIQYMRIRKPLVKIKNDLDAKIGLNRTPMSE